MAWMTPRTWVAGELVTAAILNTHLRDQLNALIQGGVASSYLRLAQSTAPAGIASEFVLYSLTSDGLLKGKSNNGAESNVLTGITPGAVVQVVAGTTSTEASSTSGTFADSNLTVDITPSRTANKVLVGVTQYASVGAGTDTLHTQLVRTSTAIRDPCGVVVGSAGVVDTKFCLTWFELDSPSSVAAVTYKTQFRRFAGAGAAVKVQPGSAPSSIVAVEVVA